MKTEFNTSASKFNDFVLNIATQNGTGSQSANTILMKSIFRMGVPVGSHNVFPSNISGLPTWFWIRANQQGFLGRRSHADITLSLNQQTLEQDMNTVKPGGVFIYNSNSNARANIQRTDIKFIGIPFKEIIDKAESAPKLRNLLINMTYVGVLSYMLEIDHNISMASIENQFQEKTKVIQDNKNAFDLGYAWAKENLNTSDFWCKVKKSKGLTENKLIIDGNTAAALGFLFGGCSFVSWYPITPSTSLVEKFSELCKEHRKNSTGKNNFAVVQTEDELAAICMVLGAGWAGCRAMTATSGPGLSLMSEAAGFSYYAEIPSVIWNVQRAGPSTGLPTRTAQSDLLTAVFHSHGDTLHPVLIPGNITECFEFAELSLNLAERLQQLVVVLSDLALGMNLYMEDEFKYPAKPLDRGKIMTEAELDKINSFHRYSTEDDDGIAARTLPGNRHLKAPYFTRGSGHNAKAQYTENNQEYAELLMRLKRKWETARNLVPPPILDDRNSKVGLIAYGSTDVPMAEVRAKLNETGLATDYLRIRSVPFSRSVSDFLKSHEIVFLIEQNRDGQMLTLLRNEFSDLCRNVNLITHFDGTPITADFIIEKIQSLLKKECADE